MNKSFTLIELLVVIVIIGILAGVIIVSTSSSINKANLAKAQSFSNTVQNELLLNLVSEWTFDEDSGATVKDTWGNNNGTAYGSPALATKEECVYGACLTFDGTDDYVDCGNKTIFNLNNTSHTIYFWFKTSSSTEPYRQFVRRFAGGTPGAGYISFISSEGKIKLEERSTLTSVGIYSIDRADDNIWHFYLATLNISTKKVEIYLDGKFQASTIYTGDLINSDSNFYIGASNYSGLIDDVRIYNGALSSSQIKQEYIAGLNSLLANGNISKEEYDQRLNNLAQK